MLTLSESKSLVCAVYKYFLPIIKNYTTNMVNAKISQDGWMFVFLHTKTVELIVMQLGMQIAKYSE